MASKVMVKMPVATTFQVNKTKSGNVNSEIVVGGSGSSRRDMSPLKLDANLAASLIKNPENARIAQLEQNIRFLQEQHDIMLTGLHSEIESLKVKNRELQFQLVFNNSNNTNNNNTKKETASSSPSSPEDDMKHKVYSSPKPINITPLQVELLDKELHELRLQLNEAEGRNVYLSAIVDEQKKKLEKYERDREKERLQQPDPELLRKLDDAEAIIRRLRRENSDLRRENSSIQHFNNQNAPFQSTSTPSTPHNPPRESQSGGRGRNGSNSGGRNHHHNSQQQQQRHSGGGSSNGVGGNQNNVAGYSYRSWFPPLQPTGSHYWQGGGGNATTSRNDKGPDLPNLTGGESRQYNNRSRGNYHHNDRKYRGGNHHRGGSDFSNNSKNGKH